jgi:periplasmic protein TonB
MKYFLLIILFSSVGNLSQAQTPNKPEEYDTIFTKPEIFAKYPGGEDEWKKYLKKNMKYPKKAWWDEMETDIIVKVTFDKDGNIKEVQHMNTSGYGFEEEAVRLVKKSGKWNPAIHRGKPVACAGSLKIEFRLK